MTYQNFVDKVDWPENIMNDEIKERMVIMPADEQGVDTQQKINDTSIFAVHTMLFFKEKEKKIALAAVLKVIAFQWHIRQLFSVPVKLR